MEVKLDKQAATTTSDFERLIQLSAKPNSVSQSETLALLVVNENVHNPHQTPSYVCKYSRCLETERHFFFKML